jgi:hypothetical protein
MVYDCKEKDDQDHVISCEYPMIPGLRNFGHKVEKRNQIPIQKQNVSFVFDEDANLARC